MANIIFKPTEKCNSNCAYCDVVAKGGPRGTMTQEMLETVFRRINEYLLENPGEKVNLIWHGGEPLTLGADYYLKAFELQEKICGRTRERLSHSLQTNMTLFDEKFARALLRLGIRGLSTSYDPEPGLRGPGERRDTAAYNKMFMRGVDLAERLGFNWSFIYVVTRRSLRAPLDIFYFLTNFSLQAQFMMTPVLLYGEDKLGLGITPAEFAGFLGAIFPVWWKNRERYPNLKPFSGYVQNIIKKDLSLGCVESGNCDKNHVYIGPDGMTSQCGRSADWDIIWYGNIKDRKLSEVLGDGKRLRLAERNAVLPRADCAGCRFWELCHGGCPLDSYPGHKDFSHKTDWCEAKKIFLEKYFEPITGTRFVPAGEQEN